MLIISKIHSGQKSGRSDNYVIIVSDNLYNGRKTTISSIKYHIVFYNSINKTTWPNLYLVKTCT